MNQDPFRLHDIRFVKRIVIGNDNAKSLKPEDDINAAVALLARCLNEAPRGFLIGVDKGVTSVYFDEGQVMLQHTSYHVGWARKPAWLD